MDSYINDERRSPTSIMLLDSEKRLFKVFARSRGWSVGKFLRVSARAFILHSDKKTKSIEEALNLAVYLDKDLREE